MHRNHPKSVVNKELVKLISIFLILVFCMSIYGVQTQYHEQYSTDDLISKDVLISIDISLKLYVPILVTNHLDPILDGEITIANGKLKPLQDEQKYVSISGRTMEVFSLLANTESELGVREVMRQLDYSSPNLAYYHLNKLYNLGYVEKSDQNKYSVVQEVIESMYPTDDVSPELRKLDQLNVLFIIVMVLLGIMTLSFIFLRVSNKTWGFTISLIMIFGSIGFAKINKNSITVI